MIFISAQDGVETKVKKNNYPLNFKHAKVKTKAIVLSSIKFQEKSLIVLLSLMD
jgi:hypothetical protein